MRYGTALIEAMEARDVEVLGSRFCTERLPLGTREVTTYRTPLGFILSSLFVLPWQLLRVLRELRRGHYRSLYLPYTHYWNLPFVWLFKWHGVPTVATIHDGVPHAGDGNRFISWVNRFHLGQADHLIFLTRYVQRHILEKVGYRASSSVYPHGILWEEMPVPKPRKMPEQFHLLFLGRVCHYKGVDLLLEAFDRLPGDRAISLTIAGEVNDNLAFPVQRKGVIWKDHWLSEAEMLDCLKAADILVLPYREATQSGVATLGVHQGIPMVCTRVGGLPEQLEDAVVWSEPEVEALVESIRELMDNPDRYEGVGGELASLRQRLTWKGIAADVEACL